MLISQDVGTGVRPQTPSRPPDSVRRLLLAQAAVGLLFGAGVVALALLERAVQDAAPGYGQAFGDAWSPALVGAFVLAAGLLIGRQQSRHPVGWLLVAQALLGVGGAVLWQVAMLSRFEPHAGLGAAAGWAALQESLGQLQLGAVLLTLLVFPTGRPPSPRWKPLLWATILVFLAWSLLHVLAPGPVREDPFMGQANPWALPVPGLRALRRAALPSAAVVGVLILISLIVRYRHSRGEQRQQIRWVGLLVAAVPLSLLALLIATAFGRPVADVAGTALWVLYQVALPIAIVVAVTRYRLYDLDLVVNRGVVYAGLSLVLLATYAGGVLVLTRLIVGADPASPGVVAAATLLVALVAAPVRRRLQDLVDRVFRRRAWRATRRIEVFTAAARTEAQPPPALRDLLADCLGDPTLRLGLWLRDAGRYVDPAGRPLDLAAETAARTALEVTVAGRPVAVLLPDPAVRRDQRLLSDVVEASRLLLQNARLQAEGLAQLAEVRASRARIVEAGDAERRRVERDLHDGAQQRLVAVALRLKLTARHQPDPAVAGELAELGAQIQAALTQVRELARGIHPAALEEGLSAALESLVARSPIPVRITLPPVSLPGETRLSAYYVAAEAVTNAVKHSSASQIDVSGSVNGETFTIRIQDAGCGGALATPGSGLAGLTDRVAAVGGQLRVHSPAGQGTLVEADLPCAC